MKARLVLKLYIHNSVNDSQRKGGGEGRGGEEQGGEGIREGEQGGIRKEEEEEKQQLLELSHQGAIPTDQASGSHETGIIFCLVIKPRLSFPSKVSLSNSS